MYSLQKYDLRAQQAYEAPLVCGQTSIDANGTLEITKRISDTVMSEQEADSLEDLDYDEWFKSLGLRTS